jgi:hypothetical protein
MPADKGTGIADDAGTYEDLPEPEEAPAPARSARPRNASGIASDANLFEGLLEESSDAVQRLDSQWLYQVHGQVFGPVRPKELLEMLYRGEITPDTPISPEDGDFLPLRRIGVFRSHLPKVEAHRRDLEAAKAKDQLEAKRRLKRRLGWASLALVAALGGSLGIAMWVRQSRAAAVEAEKAAKEAQLKAELDALLASVTIEPPLLSVVDDEPEEDPGGGKRPKRRKKSAVARISGGTSATGEITKAEIMQGMAQAFSGFKHCIVQQMQRDKDSVPEQIVLTFSVDNQGKAQNFSLTDRFLRKSPLKDCLGGQIARVQWRAYKGEVQNIEYPITIGRR